MLEMPANRCDDFLEFEPFPCIVCIVMSLLDFLVLSFMLMICPDHKHVQVSLDLLKAFYVFENGLA